MLGQDSARHCRFRSEASDWNWGLRRGVLHSRSESQAVERAEGQMGNVGLQSEERVFIDLIEDILRSMPGLRYQLHIFDPSERDENDGAYAAFMIETNPAYELEVSIKLFGDDFRLQVNGEEFSHPLESRRRIARGTVLCLEPSATGTPSPLSTITDPSMSHSQRLATVFESDQPLRVTRGSDPSTGGSESASRTRWR